MRDWWDRKWESGAETTGRGWLGGWVWSLRAGAFEDDDVLLIVKEGLEWGEVSGDTTGGEGVGEHREGGRKVSALEAMILKSAGRKGIGSQRAYQWIRQQRWDHD